MVFWPGKLSSEVLVDGLTLLSFSHLCSFQPFPQRLPCFDDRLVVIRICSFVPLYILECEVAKMRLVPKLSEDGLRLIHVPTSLMR